MISKQETTQISSSQYDEYPKIDCKEGNENDVPKSKIIASHCCALVTIIMFKFAQGLEYGFTTIIIPELYKPDAEIYITRDQLTWLSSYYFMPPVGAIMGGFLTQYIGCRKLLIICGILNITSGLMFYWSTNALMLLSAQAIIGFSTGMGKGPCFTYLAEISLPRFRTILMGCIGLSVMFGVFTSTTLGTYIYWRTLVLINIAFPSIGLILICLLPESPYWLASKNRYKDAVRSLAWFRGWTNPDSVKDEMGNILRDSDNSSSLTNITTNSITTRGRINRLKETSKQFFKRSFYIPFLTVMFIFAVNNFSGTLSFNIFSVLVFEKIDSPVDAHIGAIILSVIRTIAAIISVILVNLAGKRKILLITLPCCSIFLTIVAIFVYLTSTRTVTDVAYHWISMISILMAVFLNTIGIHKICFFYNSEIFPQHLRHIGVGAGHFINTVSESVMGKLFLYIVEGITVSGSFLLFAIVNTVGFVGMYFIVPETEGKSLKEIEEHYANPKSLGKIK